MSMRPNQPAATMSATMQSQGSSMGGTNTVKGAMSQRDMTFIVSPPDISFHSFTPHQQYETTLTFKNQTKTAKFIKLAKPESRFFTISEPRGGQKSLKVAAGLSVTYTVYFSPEEDTDYECQLIAMTETEKFIVPVSALGSRGHLLFPPTVHFPAGPIRATSRSTVLISNVGSKACQWRANSSAPFGITPSFGSIAPQGDMQVAVEFTPSALKRYESSIIFDLGNGDTQPMRVTGECHDVEISMNVDTLVIPKTFISLERQGIVRVNNSSDATVRFCWKEHGTEEEEGIARNRALKQQRGGGTRAVAKRGSNAMELPMLYDDSVFTIEPIQGEIQAKGFREFVITFNPQLAKPYPSTAFLDIQGKSERMPLSIKGTGLGPQCALSFDSLDLGDIFINSMHHYEVVLENRGSIEAKFGFQRQDTLFGEKFKFSPNAGSIAAGSTQDIEISFCSNKIGIVSETFRIHVQGSRDELELHFKGRVIGPTFHFDVEELDYGNVSYNFWHQKHFHLVNTSEIPMRFNLWVPEDGQAQKKEFDVIPSTGEILPHGQKKVQVDFLSNSVQEYNAHLVVDIAEVGDQLDSLPIKATCIVPEVVVSCDNLDYGRCFVGYRYSKEVELRNDTALSAKYEFILPSDEDPIRKKADIVVGSGDPKERKGIVHARSTQRLHVFFMAKMTGTIHLPLYVRILGSEHAPHHIQISAKVTGPTINVQPTTLDFGSIEVLHETPKPIVISNDSPIPAVWSAKLTAKHPSHVHPPFSLKQTEGTIKPQSSAHLHVNAFLDEAMRFNDELVLSVQNNNDVDVIQLVAVGKGFTLIPSIPLDLVDFGDLFTTVPVKKVFTVYNKGRKAQQIQWNNERGKAKEGDPPIIFSITPERTTILGKSEETFTIEGLSHVKGVTSEKFVCKVSQTHKQVFKAMIQANFQPPMLTYSANNLQFSYLYNPDGAQSFKSFRPLTMKNVSPLDLDFSLRVGKPGEVHPFLIDQSEFSLKRHESAVVNISFDASYREDRVSHKCTSKLHISFNNHSQKDQVTLTGDLQFPNLELEVNNVDFGCILNDTEQRRTVTVTNTSKVAAAYTWIFEEDAPVEPTGRQKKNQASADSSAVPVNTVFDIVPFRGVIPAGGSEQAEVLFNGIPGKKFHAMAVCQIEGGPDYPLALSGEANSIHYKFDRVALDFQAQDYDKWDDKDIIITNQGKVPFPFQVDLSFLKHPGMLQVSPMSGIVDEKPRRLTVSFSPKIPDRIDDYFRVQVAHFEPQIINVKGHGLYSSIVIAAAPPGSGFVHRNDPQAFTSYLSEAKHKVAQPDYKPYTTAPTKGGEPIVDPAMAEAERLYFRDIITEDTMIMKTIAQGDAAEQNQERMHQIKRKTHNNDFKYILSRYTVDLGNIIKGESKKKNFKITNTSTTQIAITVDRRALANSGITLTPDKYNKIPAHGQITIEVGLNSKGKNISTGNFSTEVFFDIKGGPLVLLEVRAFIIVPTIELSTDKLDFGKVQVGMQRIMPIVVENNQALSCDWTAVYPEEATVSRKKTDPKKGKFVCNPDRGTLLPNQKAIIEVNFIPAVSEILSQKLSIRVGANPKLFDVSCVGQGEEIVMEVQPPEIDLPSVFPYQSTRKNFTLFNKSSVPIEVFSYNFDKKYLIEDKILRNAEQHFEKDVLLLDPRQVGASLPDHLMESYFDMLLCEDARYSAMDLLPIGDEPPKPAETEAPVVAPSAPLPPMLEVVKDEPDAPKPVVVLVTGPPLCGKTTHSQLIADQYHMAHLNLSDAIRTAMEMDTHEGSVFRSVLSKMTEPPRSYTPVDGTKAQTPPPVVKVPELTTAHLATVIKTCLKAPEAVNGVVIDDLSCCLTSNAEMVLNAVKDAAASMSIPLVNICLAMDELLISLRQAHIAQEVVTAQLEASAITPLPEDQYERLDDVARKQHDHALKKFRDTKKAMHKAADTVQELHEKRTVLKDEGKLLSIQDEVEKESADAAATEDPKKKGAAKKGKEEVVVQTPWSDLDATSRFRRIYTTSKALLDPENFSVVSCDSEVDDTLALVSEAIPVPNPAAKLQAEADAEREKQDERPEVVVPPACTKQRIERPPERRIYSHADGFKILTQSKLTDAQAAAAPQVASPNPKDKKAPAAAAAGKAAPSTAAPPAQSVADAEDTRWIIPARGSLELVLQFCTEAGRDVRQELRFGVVGTNLEFPLLCKTACACPELDRDTRHMFNKKVRSRPDDKFLSKVFVTNRNTYEFGPLLVLGAGAPKEAKAAASGKEGKGAKNAAASQEAPPAVIEQPHGLNSDKLTFSNNGLFPCEVNVYTENEKERNFLLTPDNFTVPVKGSVTVTMIAQPEQVGEIRTAVIACVKDNPDPIRIEMSCFGSKPEVTLNAKKDCTVDFGRLLLRRPESRRIPIKNVSALPVKWKIVGADKLPAEIKIDSHAGVLDVGAEQAVNVSFSSERANTFNIPLKCEITDSDATTVYESLPFLIKAEAHDVVLEWTKELDFKTVRVGEAKKDALRLVNKGPYEVAYRFQLPRKLQDLITVTPLEGTLRGMQGLKEAQIVQVEVVFKSEKEIQIGRKSADLEVLFIEPTLNELVYPRQNIQLKAEALFNKFQIKPMHINFGPCMYKQKKQATFDVTNTGCFELKYKLFSIREGIQKMLDPPPEVDPKAKKAPEKKSAKKGEPAVDPAEMQLGAFVITPSTGTIPVGGSTSVAVSIMPEGSHLFSEVLGIHIEDRNPQDSPEGIAFDLEAESCVPGIVADLEHPDSDTIFEEQQIISRLDGFKKMSSVFAREEKVFSFGVALSGRRLTERFRLTNPVKVPCTVTCSILPRGDAPDAKISAEAFDIQGAKADGGKLIIPPHEHRYVTVGFTPSSLNTYSAIFEATVEGGLDAKTKTLRFELRGDGSLPNLSLEIPPPPQKAIDVQLPAEPATGKPGKADKKAPAEKKGAAPKEEEKIAPNTLVLARTIVGCKTSRGITVRNVGDLPATIRFTFPMSSQPCFSFPDRNQDINLAPGAVERYEVFFEPDKPGDYQAKLSMVVQDNHYEDVTMTILAEGYTDTLTFEDIDENTENRLSLGDCYVGKAKVKTFSLRNHSAEAVRFNWSAPNDCFKYTPAVGHLQPGALKNVQVTFLSSAVVSEMSKCSVSYQSIRYNSRAQDWDDSMTHVKWVTETSPTPSPTKDGAGGENDPDRYARSPMRKAVEHVAEPAHNVVDGSTSSKDLFITCSCDHTSWDITMPENSEAAKGAIVYKKTKLFQRRQLSMTLKNNGKVTLPFSFELQDVDGDRLVEEEEEFSIAPMYGAIPPGQTQEYAVTYAPKSVGDHNQLLVADLPFGPKPTLEIPLFGSSECPLVHFELPPNDYFATRDSDLPAVDQSSCVVEFFSRGVKIRNTVRFMVLNPTSMGYDFEWEEVRPPGVASISPFRCNTSKGSITSGKKSEMVFEFFPETLKLRESTWNFVITGRGSPTTIPFLLVGHASEPSVYFDSTRVQFGQVIVGAKTKKTVDIENRESIAYPFQFDRLPPNAAVSVSPMSGVVGPNSSLSVEITFAPTVEETFNYTLVCKVRKAVSPITCNVKGEGYTTHDSLRLQSAEGVITTLLGSAPNVTQLGTVQVNGRIQSKLLLSNQGRYNMDYKWQMPSHPFLTLSPMIGTVLPNSDSAIDLTFAPTKEVKIHDHKLACKITNGSTYNLSLNAVGASPNIHFSWKDFDFGPCFVHVPGSEPHSSTLTLTNRDKKSVAIDCLFDNKDYLEVDVSSFVLPPQEKRDIRITFLPRESVVYKDTMTFSINDLTSVDVVIKGEGTQPRVEVLNRQVRFGTCRIGDRKDVEVRVSCKSKIPTAFCLEHCLPQNLAKLGVSVSPETKMYLKPKETRSVVFTFKPQGRLRQFNGDMKMIINGSEQPFINMQGSCQGAEVHLDNKQLIFGPVVVATRVTKRVTIMNTGDLGLEYNWNERKIGADYTLTPVNGYIAAHTEVSIDVCYHPTEVGTDGKRELIDLRFNEAPSLGLSIINTSCVEKPTTADQVSFTCRVRETVTNKVVIKNDTNEVWNLKPLIDNTVWTAPDQLTVRPKESADYVITYSPQVSTKARVDAKNDEGTLFFPLPTGTALLYRLDGCADAPSQAAPPIERDVVAKVHHQEKVTVTNWLGVPQRFTATMKWNIDATDDSVVIKGVNSLDVPPNSTREYKISFFAYKEGKISGTVHFTNDDTKEYQFYNMAFNVKSAKEVATYELRTPCRVRKVEEISITNPLSKQVTLTSKCDCPDLLVPPSVVLAPKGTSKVAMEFFPLVAKDYPPSKLVFACPELGEFPYTINLSATAPMPEKPIRALCSLGQLSSFRLKFTSHSKTATDFNFKFADPKQTSFAKSNGQMVIKTTAVPDPRVGQEVEVDVTFEPSKIGECRENVEVSSATAGVYQFTLHGTCRPPERQGPYEIKPNQSIPIQFKNVFSENVAFNFTTDTPAQFILAKANETVPAKKTAAITVQYKPENVNETVRCKLTVTGQSSDSGTASWVYYLRGIKESEVEAPVVPEKGGPKKK